MGFNSSDLYVPGRKTDPLVACRLTGTDLVSSTQVQYQKYHAAIYTWRWNIYSPGVTLAGPFNKRPYYCDIRSQGELLPLTCVECVSLLSKELNTDSSYCFESAVRPIAIPLLR